MNIFNIGSIIEIIREAGDYALSMQGKVVPQMKEYESEGTEIYLENKLAFSEVDIKVQLIIMEKMIRLYSGKLGAVVEESNNTIIQLSNNFSHLNSFPEGKDTIVIDPVDGTNNYVSATPGHMNHEKRKRLRDFWGVSVCILYGKEAVVAIIYYPVMGLILVAEKGSGVYLNDQKIRFEESGLYSDEDNIRISSSIACADELNNYFPFVKPTNSFVVTSLCYIKANSKKLISRLENQKYLPKYKAYFGYNIDVVDLAGCALCYSEAGGLISGVDGTLINPYAYVAFSSDGIGKVMIPFIMAPNRKYCDSFLKKLNIICKGNIIDAVKGK